MTDEQELLAEVSRRFRELSDKEVLDARRPIEVTGWSEGVNEVCPDFRESEFVYLGGEGWFYENRGKVIDWIGSILEFNHTEGWRRQRQAFLRLMCQLYDRYASRPAWIVVQTCRAPIRDRLRSSGFAIHPKRDTTQGGPNWYFRGKLWLQTYAMLIPIEELRFAVRGGDANRGTIHTRTVVTRKFNDTLQDRPSLRERQVWWTVTHRDDAAADSDLQRGVIPAAGHLFNPTTRISEAVIISWVKWQDNGSLRRFAFELDPSNGYTLSFRGVDPVPMAMSFRMDREEMRLVHQAARLCQS